MNHVEIPVAPNGRSSEE